MPANTLKQTPNAPLSRLLEWGPASHDPSNPFSVENAANAALSRFETAADDERPDDN